MSLSTDELYRQLPAIHRIRDTEQKEALRALVAVLAEQGRVVEEDIARLYENWFIETCDEWLVPYIGDLLGVRGLHAITGSRGFTQRARVANTLRYRRRKGTATMLEQLARDSTGWAARAVEFFEQILVTQHTNHVRLHSVAVPDLRQAEALAHLGGAFGTAAHTVDVRRIASDRGRYNLANVGLFLWRLESYFLRGTTACPAAAIPDGRYYFNEIVPTAPSPLFNRPVTETEITHLATERNVPGELRRRPLHDELEAHRQALADGTTTALDYFGRAPVIELEQDLGAGFSPVPPEQILIADLSDPPVPGPEIWLRPSGTKTYAKSDGSGNVDLPIAAAVDPVLGRIAFPSGVVPNAVRVSRAYGFSGDVGGGPYDRRESLATVLERRVDWQVGVIADGTIGPGLHASLTDAVTAWNAQGGASFGIIVIMDNTCHREDLVGANAIKIAAGQQLLIVAADWPELSDSPGSAQKRRQAGKISPTEGRAHFAGQIEVQGLGPSGDQPPGTLILNGLFIDGALQVLGGAGSGLGELVIEHCTFVPPNAPAVVSANPDLTLTLRRSITGPIVLPASVKALVIEESIVDGRGAVAIRAPSALVEIEGSTVLGETRAERLQASNCIFTERLAIERRQEGCVRFCWAPLASATPRRYRCQPELALASAETAAEKAAALARVVPMFTADDFGHPGYCQLSRQCAPEIRTGADDGSEMGVFSFLQQPQREANLRASLPEFLRFGLEAGLIFVT